jgi:hypothetical protein
MFRAALDRWIREPILTGRQALLCCIFAVAFPTLVRATVSGVINGCEFTPYVPFVLICAVLLRWWQASAVVLADVAIMGGFFDGSRNFNLPCFASAAGMFLASSALMILIAMLLKRVILTLQERGADESSGGIVFSLEKGQVWASWYGQGSPVLLGSQRKVSEMMQDFLAQVELGKRLTEK